MGFLFLRHSQRVPAQVRSSLPVQAGPKAQVSKNAKQFSFFEYSSNPGGIAILKSLHTGVILKSCDPCLPTGRPMGISHRTSCSLETLGF